MVQNSLKRCYEDLAEAIITQASADYRKAYKFTRHRMPKTRQAAIADMISIERFFKSGWYALLTDLDGEYIMERIRKEVQKEWRSQ